MASKANRGANEFDSGIRRQDQRLTFVSEDDAVILPRDDNALIRETPAFLDALRTGGQTDFTDQFIRMVAPFDTGDRHYAWLMSSLSLVEGRIAGNRRIEYSISRLA